MYSIDLQIYTVTLVANVYGSISARALLCIARPTSARSQLRVPVRAPRLRSGQKTCNITPYEIIKRLY